MICTSCGARLPMPSYLWCERNRRPLCMDCTAAAVRAWLTTPEAEYAELLEPGTRRRLVQRCAQDRQTDLFTGQA